MKKNTIFFFRCTQHGSNISVYFCLSSFTGTKSTNKAAHMLNLWAVQLTRQQAVIHQLDAVNVLPFECSSKSFVADNWIVLQQQPGGARLHKQASLFDFKINTSKYTNKHFSLHLKLADVLQTQNTDEHLNPQFLLILKTILMIDNITRLRKSFLI